MTLPAPSPPSLPQAPDPDLQSKREFSSPAAFIAVVVVSALVVVLCVLGATMSGLFGFLTSAQTAAATQTPVAVAIAPSARTITLSFDDGLWLVGTDVLAGTYATTVGGDSPGCSWERNSSTDGTANSVLEAGAGNAGERLVVTIKTTDKLFQSVGCGHWVRTGD